MAETQTSEMVQLHNMSYLNQSALQMRLDTKEILEKIEIFLSGEKVVSTQDERGNIKTLERVQVGRRLMNEAGVSHYVNYVSSIINPAVVQGNYSEDWYRFNLERTHKWLAYLLTINRPEWGIRGSDRSSIIGFTMEMVIPFMSRLIDNKERESYAATIKTTENSQLSTREPGLLNRFGI